MLERFTGRRGLLDYLRRAEAAIRRQRLTDADLHHNLRQLRELRRQALALPPDRPIELILQFDLPEGGREADG